MGSGGLFVRPEGDDGVMVVALSDFSVWAVDPVNLNGQPTAENTRECGADGDMAGFRNWSNDAHVTDLARHWNLDPLQIPHMAPPTHAMQIFRYAEQGSIRMLWVSATNPAVSMPELARIRRPAFRS
jgi:anaerobic selenocysteine-containing dehydrogenase